MVIRSCRWSCVQRTSPGQRRKRASELPLASASLLERGVKPAVVVLIEVERQVHVVKHLGLSMPRLWINRPADAGVLGHPFTEYCLSRTEGEAAARGADPAQRDGELVGKQGSEREPQRGHGSVAAVVVADSGAKRLPACWAARWRPLG